MLDIYLEQAKLLHQNEKKWRGTTIRQYIPEISKLRKEYNLQTMLDYGCCLLYTSPSPRDRQKSRMPSSA